MCTIGGLVIAPGDDHSIRYAEIDRFFRNLVRDSAIRGRDAFGVAAFGGPGEPVATYHSPGASTHFDRKMIRHGVQSAIYNCRAEPTPEWIEQPALTDIQPYTAGNHWLVHNGTVANDVELRAQYGAKTWIDSGVLAPLIASRPNRSPEELADTLAKVTGSYALATVDQTLPGSVLLAANYKPITLGWHHALQFAFFTSLESLVDGSLEDRLGTVSLTPLPPYTAARLTVDSAGLDIRTVELPRHRNRRALVICSGGLDSTVAAAELEAQGYEIELLHFDYGCRAASPEFRAVRAIGENRDWPVRVVKLGELFPQVIGGSPLTGSATSINTEGNGITGAKFAHEWVPARNLILASIAVGIAEAHDFSTVALGINLEEAGSYPDNEMEFVNRLNAVMPFATGVNTAVELAMPVGHLMKHEIVARGLALDAPLHLTWSCYEGGNTHCGRCGPCFMRTIAFEMNGRSDPVMGHLQEAAE